MEPVVDRVVNAAWERVSEQWEDPARHEAFMGLVAQHSCYAWAAARYKERAGDPIADRQLDKLRKAATVAMLATSSRREDSKRSPYVKAMMWFIVLLVMLLLGLMLTRVLADHKRPTSHTRP